MTRVFILITFTVALAGSLACGSSSPTTPTTTTAADVTINIVADRGNQSYSPSPTTVRVGQTVAWRNSDSTAHNATQDGSGFASGNLNAGATSAPVSMMTAGTFTYHCTIHPGMVGTLTVQ